MAQQKQIQLGTMRFPVRSLALLRGLRIRRCHKLWCRLQIWLGSVVSMAVVWAIPADPIQPLARELPNAAGAAIKWGRGERENLEPNLTSSKE